MGTQKSAGLANIVAGTTAICTVGKEGKGLTYRGYDIDDLSKLCTFEEVAYLLVHDKLPNTSELQAYQKKLVELREIPIELRDVLQKMPKSTHPMDVLRTAVSALGCLEPEDDFKLQRDITDRLLAVLPGILVYWFQFHFNKKEIDTNSPTETIAEHFLFLLKGKRATELERKTLDVSLILYAEHEFNASTFAARVSASTLSDYYSCIVSAIGTLRGPLHGGANEAAMELIQQFSNPEEVEDKLKNMLANKQKIMGFGHRVYKESDPRSAIIKEYSRQLSQQGDKQQYFKISQAIENLMWQEKKLFPNLDFYSASAYYFVGIPVSLYTPIFVCSRVSGWAAHVFEQRENNALIRPTADYTGPSLQTIKPIDKRD